MIKRRWSMIGYQVAVLLLAMWVNVVWAGDEDVVVVDGESMDRALLDIMVHSRSAEWYGGMADQTEVRREALDDLVTMQVLYGEARRRGMLEQRELQAEIELQYKTLIGQRLIQDYAAGIEVTEEEVLERYEQLEPDRQYRIRHILVDEREKAEALIARLDDGASFARLARRHSQDDEAARDGSLGWLMLNQMAGDMGDAVRELDKGSYTAEPVGSGDRWHVIALEDVRAMDKPSLEEVRDWLSDDLLQERIRGWIHELRADADIELK